MDRDKCFAEDPPDLPERAESGIDDISIIERKMDEEKLLRYELLSNHSRDIILYLRADDQHILEANAAALNTYGYSREELLTKTIHDLRDPGTQEFTAEQLSEADTRGILFETVHQRKDGSTFPVEVSSIGATIGGVRTLISIIRDITERKIKEEALRKSESRFRQLADSMPQLVWTAEPDGRVDYYNMRYRDYQGIAPGTDGVFEWGPVLHPDDLEPTVAAWSHAVETGETYQVEHRVQMADGAYRWHLSRGIPAYDEQGRIVKWFGTATDIHDTITAQEQLRESERRYRELFETMQEALFVAEVITDKQGKPLDWRYVDVNPSLERYMGMPREQLLDHTYRETVPHPDQGWIDLIGEVALTGKPVSQERYAPTRGRWLQLNAYSPRPGQAALLFTDITERKEAEKALREYTERLRRQAAQLEATNRELESFSYSVSHDLRAPLRSLDGFSLALLEDYADRLDAEGQNFLNRIRAAAQRMASLIDNLLRLSRTTRAEIHYTTVDLSAQAQAVIEELREAQPGRRMEVIIQEGISGEGDETLLRQVLQNLLGNAWKFTAHREDARIEFGEKREDGQKILYVRDNGAGFDMNYAENLFVPFRRLHTDQEFPGTGIGLSIVKRIIDRHGGKIWAEGEPGEGAVFYFTLGEE